MRKAMLALAWRAPVFAVLLLLVPCTMALGEDMPGDDADLWRRIFTGEPIPADWVAPAARAQLTPQLLVQVSNQLQAAAGTLESVAAAGDQWRLTFARMTAIAMLSRDADGLITGLFVMQPVARAHTVDEAAAAITALPGEVALLVLHGDDVMFDHNGDEPLLVGSAFKLAVLAVVRDAIAGGEMDWADVVRIDDGHRSLPSGVLQDFPDDHPMTVATLAALMISLSDNTATDLLMGLVDPVRLEDAAGIAPVLTTRDYFKLKADTGLMDRYVAADLDGRRQILEQLADRPMPVLADIANGNAAHGWRLSARALCGLMAGVADLDLMTINTGGLSLADWDRIAFKGGSDHGILNLTYQLERDGDDPFCLSATWNAADAIDEAAFANTLASVAAVLVGQGGD